MTNFVAHRGTHAESEILGSLSGLIYESDMRGMLGQASISIDEHTYRWRLRYEVCVYAHVRDPW
jgi:hypothetical protein